MGRNTENGDLQQKENLSLQMDFDSLAMKTRNQVPATKKKNKHVSAEKLSSWKRIVVFL